MKKNLFSILISILLLLTVVDILINSKLSVIYFMILVPGYLITLHEKKSKLSITITKVVILGFVILTYYSMYLSYFNFNINFINLIILNILFITILIYVKRNMLFTPIESNMGIIKYDKKDSLELILFLLTMAIPLLLFKNTTLHEYYMGIDPYQQMIIFKEISEQSDILRSESYSHPFYGFYYFMYSITQLTGVSYHYFTKYFWLINLSLILGTIYILFLNKSKIAVTSTIPMIFLSNQFVMNRFLMSIRENFSFLFLLGLIFYLNEKNNEKKQDECVLEMALIYGAILVTHPITFLFASAIVVFYIVKEVIQRDQVYLTTLKIFLGLVFAFPILNALIDYFIWFVRWKIQLTQGSSYIPPHPGGLSTFEVLRSWTKPIEESDFSKYVLYTAPIGFLSYIYEIYKKRVERFLFVIPWLCLTLFMVGLTELGFYQSPSRLIIYIAFVLSFFSGILIENIYKQFLNKLHVVKINSKSINFPLFNVDNRLCAILLAFIIILPVTFISLTNINEYTKYSPFEENQIDGVTDFLSSINNETYILLPYPEETAMFVYLDTKNTVLDYSELIEIYNTDNLDILEQKMLQYKNVENVYFIISNRNLRSKLFPLIQLLDETYKCAVYNGITVYQYTYQ